MSWIFSIMILVASYFVGKSIVKFDRRRNEPQVQRARIYTYWDPKRN